jgi:hypothetical protein
MSCSKFPSVCRHKLRNVRNPRREFLPKQKACGPSGPHACLKRAKEKDLLGVNLCSATLVGDTSQAQERSQEDAVETRFGNARRAVDRQRIEQ